MCIFLSDGRVVRKKSCVTYISFILFVYMSYISFFAHICVPICHSTDILSSFKGLFGNNVELLSLSFIADRLDSIRRKFEGILAIPQEKFVHVNIE